MDDWLERAIDDRVGEGAAFQAARNKGAIPHRARHLAEEAAAIARTQALVAHREGKIDSEAHLRNYIQRAAVHRVRDLLRRERRNQQLEGDFAAPGLLASEVLGAPLETALAGLSRPDRLLVRLYYFERLPLKDLAGAQGVSVSTIFNRLRNICDRLRTHLEAAGFAESP